MNLALSQKCIVYDEGIKQRTQELRKKFNVKYDYTILYAPSWEYFNKEDDFIKWHCPLLRLILL